MSVSCLGPEPDALVDTSSSSPPSYLLSSSGIGRPITRMTKLSESESLNAEDPRRTKD